MKLLHSVGNNVLKIDEFVMQVSILEYLVTCRVAVSPVPMDDMWKLLSHLPLIFQTHNIHN